MGKQEFEALERIQCLTAGRGRVTSLTAATLPQEVFGLMEQNIYDGWLQADGPVAGQLKALTEV